MLDIPTPVKRDHAKYTFPSQVPPVRSASMAVLSLNFPSRFGAEDPFATIVEPRNCLPSKRVGPFPPIGLSNRAPHSSPIVLLVPAGSPELSDPINTRPCPSHAMTGSPDEAVRICANAAYGETSPGYPGTRELWKVAPLFSER